MLNQLLPLYSCLFVLIIANQLLVNLIIVLLFQVNYVCNACITDLSCVVSNYDPLLDKLFCFKIINFGSYSNG